ncbi:HAD family hydrolase [Cryobacterium sp. PH31-L1]|uniref:HAD family hydrolase n=1 Tax=Cryobacterium sp. PH31-L1 TaxID=3046199 RepID=UPI0024B8C65F|nr:HAD family hydrolase [Cryobacterium sp. PH31-L1]MDJ0376428.1 HAD family hydrolase [Cryobacterium sp. PH31-L1]
MTRRRAVLFDIDGTLVDSNYLHVEAWHRAFQTLGVDVEAWRIHRSIGQDSGQMLDSLVGDRDTHWLTEAKSLHAQSYAALAPQLRVFAQARELLSALAEQGYIVVLVTSAPEDELQILLDLLDSADAIHATTNSDDVEVAKTEPDIVRVALDRAGVEPAEAVFIGDSVWDMVAASRAGVQPFAMLCGGIAEQMLIEAGAAAIFENPADLLARLPDLGLGG